MQRNQILPSKTAQSIIYTNTQAVVIPENKTESFLEKRKITKVIEKPHKRKITTICHWLFDVTIKRKHTEENRCCHNNKENNNGKNKLRFKRTKTLLHSNKHSASPQPSTSGLNAPHIDD